MHNVFENQRKHAKMRAIERLDIFISDETINRIQDSIRKEKCIFLKKKTNTISLVAVLYPDTNNVIAVFYDKTRKTVATILPNEVLHKHLDAIAKDRANFYK
jgi:hypothetical protein